MKMSGNSVFQNSFDSTYRWENIEPILIALLDEYEHVHASEDMHLAPVIINDSFHRLNILEIPLLMIADQERIEQELGNLKHAVTVPKNEKTVGDKISTCLLMILPSGFVALLIVAAISSLMNLPLQTRQMIALLLMIVLELFACRAVFKYKSKAFLALFEDGFAVRNGWQKVHYRFDQIEKIGFGQVLTDLENQLQGIGWLAFILSPKVKRVHDDAARSMITVILKSGKRQFLKGVLVRFPEEATRDFFSTFQQEHPELWQ